ncbi:MAG: tetratricopeptide repeat protein [Pelagibacteraceae bacterium]
MKKIKKSHFSFIIQIIFFISIFNSIYAKNFEKNYDANSFSNYFSGILSLNEKKYENSYKYLKTLKGLEKKHFRFSTAYQESLISLDRFDEAFSYAKKLERQKIDAYETNLIIGVYYLKNNKFELAKKYFKKYNKLNAGVFSEYLNNWLLFPEISIQDAIKITRNTSKKFNLKSGNQLEKIQNVFIHCYFDSPNTENIFKNTIINDNEDYSRYYFFHSNYYFIKNDILKAKKIINSALKLHPEKVILNQMHEELKSKNKTKLSNQFNCENLSNVVAEIFYIISNILSSQQSYSNSNLYLNLATYLNPNFISYDALKAENFFETKNYKKAKKIYQYVKSKEYAYGWYASKIIASIQDIQNKKSNSLKFLQNEFKEMRNPNIYQTLDYANFLKNKKKYKEAISYYSTILDLISKKDKLYPEVTQGRGEAFERLGEWEKAEKDLLSSLESSPDQAYVINYLAYTWIEKGINLDKSLEMLKKANQLKENDGYIIDSLGWAFFKLKRYKEAKDYLQLAVSRMPSDPVINDHYGDSLWMNNQSLQARYYWKYVLNLEKTEPELKELIKKKLTNGLKFDS